jgi:hypothetical protein
MRQSRTKPCRICGQPVTPTRRKDRKAFYYPRQCADCSHRMRDPEHHRQSISKALQGMHHPQAQPLGTRRLHRSADELLYWQIKVSPTGRWPYEHRWIVQQRLGRTLLKTERVHHKNHDTLDNSDDNLVLLDHGSHSREHHSLLEGQWSLFYEACQKCGSTAKPHCSKGLCTACYQQEARLNDPERYQSYERARLARRRQNRK